MCIGDGDAPFFQITYCCLRCTVKVELHVISTRFFPYRGDPATFSPSSGNPTTLLSMLREFRKEFFIRTLVLSDSDPALVMTDLALGGDPANLMSAADLDATRRRASSDLSGDVTAAVVHRARDAGGLDHAADVENLSTGDRCSTACSSVSQRRYKRLCWIPQIHYNPHSRSQRPL